MGLQPALSFWQYDNTVIKTNKSIQTWYFALTIFLSAFLLFEVQPILGKYILPWFGGTSSVWTTCMLIYQSLLLLGYLYVHVISKLSLKRQAFLHVLFLVGSIILILSRNLSWETPILPGANWKPSTDSIPFWHIVILLGSSIGLPFIILSSTSTLLQFWFSQLHSDKNPYTFYMVSNIGSLLALLSYPFIIEPFFPLRAQGFYWPVCYSVFVMMCGYCAVRMFFVKSESVCLNTGRQSSVKSDIQTTPNPTFKLYISWLFFSTCSSIILLATTSQITQNVAPVPLLWILPLSVYLFSFAICFRPGATTSRDVWIPIMLVLQGFSLYSMHINTFIQITAHTCTLFACCMISHNELYRLKPPAHQLTLFYLMIAIGGAIGGILTAIIAPLIFKNLFEFGFILIIYGLLAICIMSTKREKWMRFWYVPLSVVSLIIIALLYFNARNERLTCISRSRNFYGSLSIRKCTGKRGNYTELLNGRIKHGIQFESGPLHKWPTEYFSAGSGVGMAFRYHPKRLSKQPIRVGAIGLGIGTIASYGHTNDYFRFYEINPEVVKIANDRRYFTYLSDSSAKIDIIPGDARISMEREKFQKLFQNFDILVVDAFNSDAIPVHLLTKEAFNIYLYHLAPDGIIAFHVSNSYLDLVPVALSAAKYLNLDYAVITTYGDKIITQTSIWVLITQNRTFTELPVIATAKMKEEKISRRISLWTDDFSNILSVMKRR
ncbi:MAG: fused MFS/spermidine synthase [Kiritimatiellae bacterium]|nr:fused MFS/spermidine synthase [Kiritimatiellia bacterium]